MRGQQRGTKFLSLSSRDTETLVKPSRKIIETVKASQPFVPFPVIWRKKCGFGAENSGFSLTRSDNFALLLPDKGAIQKNCHQRRGDTQNE
tara:strand:+ start:2187 stop:2459 length:273 start_codon:yes stop_codon:yes gene_type:complete